MEDKEKDKQEKVSEKSVFNVSVIYRLDGDDLIVEVPFDDLEYKEDYPIYYLSVLPYFGASGTTDEGFLFVPEGGGASNLITVRPAKTVIIQMYMAGIWDRTETPLFMIREPISMFLASRKMIPLLSVCLKMGCRMHPFRRISVEEATVTIM